MTELHTTTLMLKRMREMKSALQGALPAFERAFLFICENHPLGPTNQRTEAGKLIDSLRVPLSSVRGVVEPPVEPDAVCARCHSAPIHWTTMGWCGGCTKSAIGPTVEDGDAHD